MILGPLTNLTTSVVADILTVETCRANVEGAVKASADDANKSKRETFIIRRALSGARREGRRENFHHHPTRAQDLTLF